MCDALKKTVQLVFIECQSKTHPLSGGGDIRSEDMSPEHPAL